MDVAYPISRVTKNMTVTLRVTGMWRFRLGFWLLTKATSLAVKIGGFNGQIEADIRRG